MEAYSVELLAGEQPASVASVSKKNWPSEREPSGAGAPDC